MHPFFSIIIPIYNINEKYLRKCIQSALNQGNIDYEIILVDDGSEDYCGNVCKEYEKKNSLIRYIYQENQGVSVARNKGIDAATGEYIVFLDADDWMPCDFLMTAFSKFDISRPDVVFYGYSSEYENRSLKRYFPIEIAEVSNINLIENILQMDNKYGLYDPSTIWAKFIRRDVLNEYNIRFKEGLKKGQDTLFSLYLYQNCITFGVVNDIGYCYRKNDCSIMHRYNKNIIQMVNELHESYAEFITSLKIGSDREAILSNLRVNALLGEFLNLYFCHKDNPKTYEQKKREYKELITEPRYMNAINIIHPHGIVRRIQIFALKNKKIGWIWAINKIHNILQGLIVKVYN